MRYFVLQQDERITDRPYTQDFFSQIDVRKISSNKGGFIPVRTLIRLTPSEFMVFPDVLCTPTLLITREIKDTIKAYDAYVEYRQIVYLDTENEQVQLYFMPLLDAIDCLSENSQYANKYHGEISQVVLKRAPIRDKCLFEVKNSIQRIFIIRLDLAESLLARNCKGFTLAEAVIEEE